MASSVVCSQVWADEIPPEDIDFFIFLSNSLLSEQDLITPMDMQELDMELDTNTTPSSQDTEDAKQEVEDE